MCPCIAAQSLYQPVLSVWETCLPPQSLSFLIFLFPANPFSLSLFFRLYPRLCSHADPPVHLTAQMATDKLDSKILWHNGPLLFCLSPVLSKGFIFQKILGAEGKGLSYAREQKPEHEIVYIDGCAHICPHKMTISVTIVLYICSCLSAHVSLGLTKVRRTVKSIK